MTKTILALTSVKPDGDAALEEYLAVVGPLMESAGAKLKNRYEVSQGLSVPEPPQFVSIVEYPNADAVSMVFDNPAYVSLKSVRDTAFSRYEIMVLD